MRVLVVGAGAVGGYFGALLSRGGHDVVFVARGANLAAIRADRLMLDLSPPYDRRRIAEAGRLLAG